MQWIQIAIFAMRMIIKYGPKAWKIGKGIYDDVEAKFHEDGRALSSDESARVFNLSASTAVTQRKVRIKRATTEKLNELREDVWRYKNPGKSPKALYNARYRVMPKNRRGKAR